MPELPADVLWLSGWHLCPRRGKGADPPRGMARGSRWPLSPGFAAPGTVPVGRARRPRIFILPSGQQCDNIDCYLRRALGSQEAR